VSAALSILLCICCPALRTLCVRQHRRGRHTSQNRSVTYMLLLLKSSNHPCACWRPLPRAGPCSRRAQIYTAEEKAALAMFNFEENKKKEEKVLADMKALVHRSLGTGDPDAAD